MNPSGAVLIVDDELRSRESLHRVLSEEFDVLCAQNAQEAEAILAGDLVQVILCDQRMPGETGVDFLRRVRETWPDPVRMIISGFSESEDIIAGVNEAGIYQYVTKPWHPEKLIECVRDAVKLYRMQKEPGGSAPTPSLRMTRSIACWRTGGASSGGCSNSTASSMSRMGRWSRRCRWPAGRPATIFPS